ncbi:MAG: hypothetical protein FWH26_02935 [Oscillospiraceae bacterium]|nr:hypothetical protein [Oscillospiraceae bacterium]
MSEPAKKPGQQPESYSPKKKPEIVSMAQAQAQRQTGEGGASQATSSSGGSGVIPVSHPLNRDMSGENYWFNGCARFAMECLGETDYDYWFFAGLTGDIFTQFYPKGAHNPNKCAISAYFMGPDYAKWVFGQVGYACEYVTEEEVLADRARYLKKIADSIDRGVPVINSACEGVIVGYEDGALLYYAHEWAEPKRLTLGLDRFIEEREVWEGDRKFCVDRFDLIFVGEKTREVSLALLYRDAIARLPELLTGATEEYVFGARAFRTWANDIERGKFDDPALFDDSLWEHYTNYVCVLATNGSCCFSFLEKAMELNPDMAWLKEVYRQYRIMGMLWIGSEGNDEKQQQFQKEYEKQHGKVTTLEKLGGGFNVSYKTLQNKKKRAKIVARIRVFADCADNVVRILEKGL